LENDTRHRKIHDGFYGFDESCVVSDDLDSYGAGRFGVIGYDDFTDTGNQLMQITRLCSTT